MEIELQFSPLASYQRRILESQCRYTITEASTKVGKTYSHIVWLLNKAVTEGELGRNYWWVAPVSSQAEIAFDRMERYLGVLINRRLVKTNKSKLYVQLWNGARIWFKSADKPDSLYGEDVYAAVFDEFTRAKETAWFALRSTITKTRAMVKFIGNKTNPNHWGSKLVEDVEKGKMVDWEYHKITAWDAVDEGILSREEIEAAKRELPDDVFAALYEVKWIELNGNPFWRHIDLNKVVRPVSYDPRLPVYLSFDYNIRNSCLVAQRTADGERRYLEEYYMLGGDGEDLEALVRELALKYRNNIIYITGDASGNARSAFTSGSGGGRALIEMYFQKYGAEWVYFDYYPTSNPEHVNSRLICNALTKFFGDNISIDPSCVTLISDIKRMKTTIEGGLDKSDMNKEDYGHMGDTFRYDLMNFDMEVFASLGYAA
ncbi:ferritin family protein [Telluribacter humicola]|uniref:hypothetical protein n=1 Tax=Telluribacter humicola TaxID=1720261 RepID=UPI001A9579CD|nr:hypothetical protein [Telluribacter humicola]